MSISVSILFCEGEEIWKCWFIDREVVSNNEDAYGCFLSKKYVEWRKLKKNLTFVKEFMKKTIHAGVVFLNALSLN